MNSFKCFLLWSIISCSHKKKVLHFLEQLCSFYENNYLLESSKPVESSQAFIDKVCEFAEANELSSKTYRAALSDFSADKSREQLIKVLCHWRYSFSIWELLCSFCIELFTWSIQVAQFLYRLLGLESGVNAVITNGRVSLCFFFFFKFLSDFV